MVDISPAAGIADEGGSNQVGEHFGIGHFAQVMIDLLRQYPAALSKLGIEFENFGGEGVGLDGKIGAGPERLDPRDGEGGLLIEFAEFHPPNALQNEIRSAVAAFDAGRSTAELARLHNRSRAAVEARLLKLGKIDVSALTVQLRYRGA